MTSRWRIAAGCGMIQIVLADKQLNVDKHNLLIAGKEPPLTGHVQLVCQDTAHR